MKTLCSLLLITLLFIACKKDDDSTAGTGIAGKWKSTETLFDIGNGTTNWSPIKDSESTELQLLSNGNIKGDANYQSYYVKDSLTVEFRTKDNKIIPFRYQVTESNLILGASGCIEACLIKYKRLK